jgi:hypothetical protein
VNRGRLGRSLSACAALALSTSGCVVVGWGTFPEASGEGVEEASRSIKRIAKIRTADVSAEIELETYVPSALFAGLILPLLPVPTWGLPRERLQLRITVSGESERALVEPESLRVVIGGREYAPTSLEVWDFPGNGETLPSDQPIRGKEDASIRYNFRYLPSPREPFSIAIRGLPRIDYTLAHEWIFIRAAFPP